MKLVVFGGSGLVGSRVCRLAAQRGWDVTSVSRSGAAAASASLPTITTLRADVFDPAKYRRSLHEADAVVHAIGSIMEDVRYKNIVSSSFTLPNLLKGARDLASGPNPLARNTFTRLNTDSARVIAENTRQDLPDKLPFVYISAEAWNRFVDPRYISSKRQAESLLSGFANLRPVFIRPGFISGSSQLNSCWPGTIRDAIGTALKVTSPQPLVTVDTVAEAVIQAIGDPTIDGVVPNEALHKLQEDQFDQSN